MPSLRGICHAGRSPATRRGPRTRRNLALSDHVKNQTKFRQFGIQCDLVRQFTFPAAAGKLLRHDLRDPQEPLKLRRFEHEARGFSCVFWTDIALHRVQRGPFEKVSRKTSNNTGVNVFRRYLVTKTIGNRREYTAGEADIIAGS